jgi:hypothetical protein
MLLSAMERHVSTTECISGIMTQQRLRLKLPTQKRSSGFVLKMLERANTALRYHKAHAVAVIAGHQVRSLTQKEMRRTAQQPG